MAIIGMGEVGTALSKILPDCSDYLHICFPYSKNFINEVKKYQKIHKPKYTIIHSTIPVGTSRQCGALHSPIRGMHPYLEEGIKIFPKFIGGEEASLVADYFRKSGIKIILCDTQEETELGKLLDTEYYRICIEFVKKAKKLCDKYKIPFSSVYTEFNRTYNEGYVKLGYSEYQRPILQPIMTPVGGHCVRQNSKLL